jgi:hypothetical protein
VSIPAILTAGDSLSLSVPAYGRTVEEGWGLSVVLVPADGSGTRITATSSTVDPDDAGAFLLEVPAATTATWAARAYTWVLQATKGSERNTLATGSTTVRPDPLSASTLDTRSTARLALAAIDAYLLDSTNLKAASYSIAGRSLSRYTRAELMAERSKWQMEVANEEAADRLAAGLPSRSRIFVRFGA